MDELKILIELAKGMPAQVTGAVSLAVIVYTMLLKKRGVDITEKTSASQAQISQMDALIRNNKDLASQLFEVQGLLSKQLIETRRLSVRVSDLEDQLSKTQRQCNTCPGNIHKPGPQETTP